MGLQLKCRRPAGKLLEVQTLALNRAPATCLVRQAAPQPIASAFEIFEQCGDIGVFHRA